MFGFPLPLYNSGASGVKLTNNADSGFPKPNIGETFYSIKDGNWSDTNVWQTASGRVGLLPTANDDVYIRHSINSAIAANTTNTINNLYISTNGTLVMTGGGGLVTLSILGNFQCQGLFNGSGGQGHLVKLFGIDNRIDNYLFSASTTIAYTRNGDQYILNLNYYHLSIDGIGTKYLQSNTILLGNFNNQGLGNGLAILECGCYDFTVNGISSIRCSFSKNNSGNILFIGAVTIIIPSSSSGFYGFILSGNPNVEFRGGVDFNNLLAPFNSGTGTWSFTTNNQTMLRSNSTGTLSFDCNINIGNGVTLTINTGSTSSIFNFNNIINSLNATGKLLQASSSGINFATQTAAENSMSVGIVDFTTNANTVQFNGNYSATIPSYFTTFSSLTIGGIGTKTLGVNTTVNGALLVNGGTLQLSTYNLDVFGTTSVAGSSGSLLKSGAGSLLFRGQMGNLNGSTNNATIDFSVGNPTVECRGGIARIDSFSAFTFKTGTGAWTLSTNNQTISNAGNTTISFDCSITILGAINISTNSSSTVNAIIFNQPINGTVAGSTLINIGLLYFANSTTSMSTGTFDFTTNLNNIVGYTYNGSGTIPFTTFRGLLIGGTGTKTVSGNLTVNYNLYVSSGILDLTTYNLTVNGTTTFSGVSPSAFVKSGAGSILFVGQVTQIGSSNTFKIDLSGNPTVELRNGIALTDGNMASGSTTGTGVWTFSTNNQSISGATISSTNGLALFQCPILISGAITLTLSNTTAFNNSINGDNAASKFLMAASQTLTYKSATQPMATGILDTSTNLNTWIYGSGNQNIKGGASLVAKQVYRNLTLNGGGTKTLQGYVSVLNTYTLTSPATLALNGFTLTNP